MISQLARLAGVLLVLAASAAHGQGYPAKPARIVVPFAPAGTPEQFAAYIRDGLSRWTRIVKDANVKVD